MSTRNSARVISALVVGLAIFLAAVVLPKFVVSSTIPRLLTTQALELGLSLLAIALLGKRQFADYGFRLPSPQLLSAIGMTRLVSIGLVAVAVGACATVAVLVTGANGNPLVKQLSFPQIMLFVWLFSSTIEEIFTRGFLQSHLATVWGNDTSVPVLGVGLPTLVSALCFACMHLILLATGADAKTTVIILVFTFSVGLLAGHLRARTDSLIPAIAVHMLANIGGVVGGVIYAIIMALTGGKMPAM